MNVKNLREGDSCLNGKVDSMSTMMVPELFSGWSLKNLNLKD